MGSGLEGRIDGRRVSAGSRDLVLGGAGRPTTGRARAPARLLALGAERVRRGRWPHDGALLLADELRSETPHAIRMLREPAWRASSW